MSDNPYEAGAVSSVRSYYSRLSGVCLSSALLSKLAKHLVVIACLIIIGGASRQSLIGQLGIFLLIVLAALIHSAGRAVQRRSLVRIHRTTRGPHDRGTA
jgi:hypothetical protein